MFKLAFRNIFRNRLRTALTLAAIICGVAAIIVSGGFVEDVFVQLRESTIHSRLGHAQIFREGYLEYGRRDPSRYLIEQPQPLIDQRALDSPRAGGHDAGEFLRAGQQRPGRSAHHRRRRGAGQGSPPGNGHEFVAGHTLQDADPFGVIIGEGVATALQLKPGSPLNLTVNTPEGALNTLEFKVVGVFRTFSKDYDDRAVRIPQAAAQELLYTPAVHSVVVVLDDTAHTDAVVNAVQGRLGKHGYEVKSWHELADFYNKTVALYKRQFGALQFIILVMLVLSVASTVNMVVYERTGEFGTLLAIGLTRREIFRWCCSKTPCWDWSAACWAWWSASHWPHRSPASACRCRRLRVRTRLTRKHPHRAVDIGDGRHDRRGARLGRCDAVAAVYRGHARRTSGRPDPAS